MCLRANYKCSALCLLPLCEYTNVVGASFFPFLYVFVASSPCLVLCPPTQNGAILSPSVPEMKYKPLKCILILPCRLRLKNKHTHACMHTDTHTHTHQLKRHCDASPLLFLRRRLHACGRWLFFCFACRHIKQNPRLRPRLV